LTPTRTQTSAPATPWPTTRRPGPYPGGTAAPHSRTRPRVGIDPDGDQRYIVANGLAIVVMETLHVLRRLHAGANADADAAADALDGIVRNWSDLIAGIPGAIRRPKGSSPTGS
jgi:hypothetical protein